MFISLNFYIIININNTIFYLYNIYNHIINIQEDKKIFKNNISYYLKK